jgi:uncharacterized protein (DUF1330 family)
MTAYAIGHLHDVRMGAEIVAYLEGIDATLAPFGGRFVIHGGPVDLLEGEWSGDLVAIAFPDRAAAHAWYASDAYRAIAGLRTRNACGTVLIIDGVDESHRATDILGSG